MENQQMDAKTRLTKALAAGAVIMSRPNIIKGIGPDTQIKTAYLKLKETLQARYKQVDEDLLDIGPGSEERQETMANQLEEAGATEDEVIMQQAQELLDIIYKVDPSAIWASAVAEPPAHLK
jgi:hypothetical protein